jgi:hypothetical protein
MESKIKKDKNKIKKDKNKIKIKKEKNKEHLLHRQSLYKSLTKNYLFYITLFLCIYCLKKCKGNKSSYMQLLVSFVFAGFVGYFVHYISHRISFASICHKNKDNILMQNSYCKNIILATAKFCDFHHNTHHDSSINKTWINIFYEFINNLYMQGFGIILLIKFIDIKSLLLWSIMYATIHQGNYFLVSPSTHADHHTNSNTNYGIDILDILFNTKFDMEDVETHNHGSINLILATLFIMLLG